MLFMEKVMMMKTTDSVKDAWKKMTPGPHFHFAEQLTKIPFLHSQWQYSVSRKLECPLVS